MILTPIWDHSDGILSYTAAEIQTAVAAHFSSDPLLSFQSKEYIRLLLLGSRVQPHQYTLLLPHCAREYDVSNIASCNPLSLKGECVPSVDEYSVKYTV